MANKRINKTKNEKVEYEMILFDFVDGEHGCKFILAMGIEEN